MNNKLENPSRRRLFRGKVTPPTPSLRLPWIKNEDHFLSNCTQCGDCIEACETNIIIKDDAGFPAIDFSNNECTFCDKCHASCQQPLFVDKHDIKTNNPLPWPAQLEINNQCLAENNIFCQSCQDVCETSAIVFDFKKSSIPTPTINLADCTQCGACISTCPQDAISLNLTKLEITHV
ncbi:ferredoxin-type protein NapF [Thalassotalea profundi]|uniref:Ferredoxin-type protein NapF n=1 Tax=Thalassotalea profundi TaxID=2036687 RepID=A0ABQ3ING2_9GAMM|nr:ferredoxin-type protein NapF [Thalassotalea profundi]GHE87214.1 ferredoxin-type protein NapF [Thalassotalea profundi]